MGNAFAGIFRDLGGEEHLPTLTTLAVSLWFPPLLGLVVALATARGVRGALPLTQRRLWVLGAMVFAGVSIGACVIGVYMPMFMLSGNIKP